MGFYDPIHEDFSKSKVDLYGKSITTSVRRFNLGGGSISRRVEEVSLVVL